MGEDDPNLRPLKLNDFIGQKQILSNLGVYIESARKRGVSLDHVLLSGPPGLGKTTLATIIANEMGVAFTPTSAPAISKGADLGKFLTQLTDREILFIDEIHGFQKKLEELLYPAMENYILDFVAGEAMTAQAIQIPLRPFTLVGATTRSGTVSEPLRNRFGIHLKLDYYSEEEMAVIVARSAKILQIDLESGMDHEIGKRSRRTPRIANHLLKRVRDFAEVAAVRSVNQEIAENAFLRMGIDNLGLDGVDRQILQIIIERFRGGPVGLKPISAIIGEEERTIEDNYESYLVRIGLIDRTPQGRVASRKAYEHLGLDFNQKDPTLFSL
jgi:holliday junction DNA helicase RuvB